MTITLRLGRLLGGALLGAVLLASLVSARPLYSQSSPVSATIDKSDITHNETFTLKVKISDQTSVSPPTLPRIEGVRLISYRADVYRESRDGAFLANFEFIYVFQPRRVGKIEIDPVSVRIGANTYLTAPLEVNVTQGASGLPAPTTALTGPDTLSRMSSLFGEGSFSEAKVDNERPYLGQQITYTFKFYATDNPYRPMYRAPDFAGFWNTGQQPDANATEEVDGRDYTVTEMDTILFPNLAGDMTIEPGRALLPTGVFGSRRSEFPSDPVELSVRPLPANEPPGFTGAVGRYVISATVDADSTALGDPVVMTVRVSGIGNLSALPDPEWPDVPGMRAYDGDTSVETMLRDGMWTGSKTFKRALIPDATGSFDLPPIEYAYFDPELERYETVSSAPIRVSVVPDPSGRRGQPELAGADDSGDSTILLDILHIKPPPGGIGTARESVTSSPLYWTGWGAPILAALAAAGWVVAARKRSATAKAGSSETARALALSRLSDLGAGASSADAAHVALRGYLAAVLGRQAATLAAGDVSEMVTSRGASPETARQLESTLATLDRLRFSPAGGDDGETAIHDVAEIVQRLAGEMSQ